MRAPVLLVLPLLLILACGAEDDPGDDGGSPDGATEDGGGADAGGEDGGATDGGGTDGGVTDGGATDGGATDGGATDGGADDGGTSDGGTTPTEPPELAGILQAHNDARDVVGVPHLVWDDDLVAIAAAWIATCTDNEVPTGLLDHNAGRSDTYPGYVGENIYASSGTANGVAAVQAWVSEEAHYDIVTNTCAPNQVCGHYTQVVWGNTERVGCARGTCSGLTYSSTIVCDYSPGGNYSGQRPYPYP
ncbi:MAG: CAP domain-containing protein [Deltaproteobacteria bacterium]|nr:CAP domain-containing protein [Deltaproteobacteria bacterium]